MYVNEMILVVTNEKGTEKGALMIYPDYLQKVVFEHAPDKEVIATMVEDIVTTRSNDTAWGEHYWAANNTTYAKYCKDQYELKRFLSGGYQDGESFELDIDACSKECLELLDALNITLDGKQKGSTFHYEKGNRIYEVRDIVHNFNGSDYRVMERYSDKNMLLMDVNSGNFVVGIGVCQYARYPAGANEYTPEIAEVGVEWDHGVYLPNMPSAIDFAALRREYGEALMEGKGEYQVEIRETLSSVQSIEAESMEDALYEAEQRYRNEDVVLDDSNHIETEYIPVGKSR